MRKLLVASQKGGVGKTTTSVNLAAAAAAAGARVLLLDADPLGSISASLNLAQHPSRQTLRQAGLDLPGVAVADAAPGLDVLGPYDEGGCSDEELDDLLRLLAEPAVRQRYGCLLVNAPPFLGANPAQLAGTCDELLLVMRAEPMAYRTLPAFLELVQRARRPGGKALTLRGILLTLPENESPGGRWERELRGRLGTRILPQVVPHDEEVTKAQLFGQIAGLAAPEAPASGQYRDVAGALDLAAEAGQAGAGSLAAALLVASRGVVARPRALVGAGAATRVPALVEAGPTSAGGAVEAPEEPSLDDLVADVPAPSRLLSGVEIPLLKQMPPPPDDDAPRGRGRAKAPPEPVDAPEAADEAAPAAGGVTPPAPSDSKYPLLVLVGLGAALAFGLRMLQVPPFLVHLVIGAAVAGGVFLLLRLVEAAPKSDRPTGKERKAGEPRKAPRAERKSTDARLAALSRRAVGSPPRRDPKR